MDHRDPIEYLLIQYHMAQGFSQALAQQCVYILLRCSD